MESHVLLEHQIIGNQILLEQQILDLEQGSHLCLFYERDPLEQMPALIPFIKQALGRNERFIYIADDISVEQLSLILKINGIDVEAQSSRGALKLWTRREWRQPGELDPRKKSEQVQGLVDDALKAGFKGVRFAVEMTWTLGPDISVEKLEHWEATINTIFTPDIPGEIICQYNRHRLPASVINQAFRTHPHAIIDNCIYHSAFYKEAPIILNDRDETLKSEWMMSRIKKGYIEEKVKRINGKTIDYKNLEWGTHICNFYKTKEDLIELLVPYFKAGLENNERTETLLVEACRELENRVKQRTAELLKSLEEKEVLLKEIHHRVKNNLQVISSLIRLQSVKLEDKKAVKVLEECQNRIKAMALVHEALYRSNDITTLNISDYISSLGHELLRSYNLNPDKIRVEIDIKDVTLDMDTGIACGLILSELITNSIKYAFPDGRDGRIKVNLSTADDRAKLSVSDDGIGLPKDFDINSSRTLGMRLVKMLTSQLEGELEIKNGCGTSFEIEFPIMKVL